MGAHALPVVTSVVMRDTAEVFDHHALDPEVVVEQARSVLEDVTIAAWKVGFLARAEGVSAVAEMLSDYPDVPLVAYMPNLSWVEEDEQQAYLDAFRELVLPQTEVLVGSHQTLTDFLLPDWDSERPASPRELAVAAAEHGTRFVLVTSVPLPDQFLDNVLASAQGAITGEKFERFEVELRRRRRHAVGGAGRAAGRRQRAAHGRGRIARLPRPGARRGLPPRHGQRDPRPLLLGAAARRGRRARSRRRPRRRGEAPGSRHVH